MIARLDLRNLEQYEWIKTYCPTSKPIEWAISPANFMPIPCKVEMSEKDFVLFSLRWL